MPLLRLWAFVACSGVNFTFALFPLPVFVRFIVSRLFQLAVDRSAWHAWESGECL